MPFYFKIGNRYTYYLVFARQSSLLLDVKREGLGLYDSVVPWHLDHRQRLQVLELAGGGANVLAEAHPPCAEEASGQ